MKNKKVNYADEASKLKAPKEHKKKVPKIKKCSYSGCPINAATLVNGRYACNFHDSADFHDDVTDAIKSNITFIQGYNRMVRWGVADWIRNSKRLKEHELFPMEEDETPSGYITRFFGFIEERIKEQSSKATTNRLNNMGGF